MFVTQKLVQFIRLVVILVFLCCRSQSPFPTWVLWCFGKNWRACWKTREIRPSHLQLLWIITPLCFGIWCGVSVGWTCPAACPDSIWAPNTTAKLLRWVSRILTSSSFSHLFFNEWTNSCKCWKLLVMPLHFFITAWINVMYVFSCSLCKVLHQKTVKMSWSRSCGTTPDCIRTPFSPATCSGNHIVRICPTNSFAQWKVSFMTKCAHTSGSWTKNCNK